MSIEIDIARARELVNAFSRSRLLVFGDFMLDRYVWGGVDRISPESPVPVVVVDRESSMLGGAGNVARNGASLGAQVEVVTVVGDDAAAAEIRRLLATWKLSADGLVVDPERPTTEKTRVIARGQQVVRYDRESDLEIPASCAEQVLEAVRVAAERVDGVIIEDYAKGMLGRDVVLEAMEIFNARNVRCFVDPKTGPWSVFRGAELVKPNLREAEELTRMRVRNDADLERVGRALLEETGAALIAITRDAEGMTLFPADGATDHAPGRKLAVSDRAGAGDTAITTLALARLSGATWREAALLANAAGAFVVSVPGTATLTQADLLGVLGAAP